MAYAIYDGLLPVVAPTIYLRHLRENDDLEPNTVESYGYALLIFFRFLEKEKLSFWQLVPADIKRFKRLLLTQREAEDGPRIRHRTAGQYLAMVKGLIQYWRGLNDDDPLFLDAAAEMDGARHRKYKTEKRLHKSWYERVPQTTWRVKIPQAEKQAMERYRGLSPEACRVVMDVLESADYHSDVETLLRFRNRAVWTFMLMTGLRKGELVRIRWDDVNQSSGMVYLRERSEDAWLGELKTGKGEIFVTPTNPCWRFLEQWLLEGRWIAEKRLKDAGLTDHGMLFSNHDGGPLTQAAVENLFARLKRACGFGDNVFFSPHVTRHTIATTMLNNGVGEEEVQQFLRHRSLESTRIYAKVSTARCREALQKFWASCGVIG
jgi:site-specific recombinase XerD